MRGSNQLQVRHTARQAYSIASKKQPADNLLEYFPLPSVLN